MWLRAGRKRGTLRGMRLLGVFGAGVLAGAIGMVLWFTLDPDWNSTSGAVRGGGNITVTFDEQALAAMIAGEILALGGAGGAPAVDVEVESAGLVRVAILPGASGAGLRASLVLDPDVVEGRLHLRVTEAVPGAAGTPEALARLLEEELGGRLDEAAGALPYRLVSIRTVERRLSLDLKLE